MKNLSRNQRIAVFAGMAAVGYLLFAGPIMDMFSQPNNNAQETMQNIPETGVVFEDTVVGTGDIAEAGDTVTVHYVGTLLDGQIFDSSLERNVPFEFVLGTGHVIRGWDEGFSGMRVGGKRRLIIAPDYGYGSQGGGPIPPNSTLIFDVELLDVNKPSSR